MSSRMNAMINASRPVRRATAASAPTAGRSISTINRRRRSTRACSTRCCRISPSSSATRTARAMSTARRPRRRSSGRASDVARLIGADPREIVFTSGATEANNLALKGVAHFARAHPQAGAAAPRDRIVTLATEHKCVLESAAALGREGFDIVSVPVEPNGLVSLDRLADALDERTLIVSVMAAHNEIGVIQPLGRDRRAVPLARRAVPHRRGAGLRQNPARCRGDEDRPDVDLRPQNLRTKGHRRALCQAPAARAPAAAVRRRRAGARLALRHIADPALRRSRTRRRDRARGNGVRSGAAARACATGCRET